MIDDARRLALAFLLRWPGVSERKLCDLIDRLTRTTRSGFYSVADLEAHGYIVRDAEDRFRVTDSFRHFRDDFEISLTRPSGGRQGMMSYPLFMDRSGRPSLKYCFVMMPFGGGFDDIYTKGIQPGVLDAGIRCRRADDIFAPGPIIERVWQYLTRCGIAVADLTTRNANVFYELGIAHTIGCDVILLAQDAMDVPIDLRQHRLLLYEAGEVGLAELRRGIGDAVRDVVELLNVAVEGSGEADTETTR